MADDEILIWLSDKTSPTHYDSPFSLVATAHHVCLVVTTKIIAGPDNSLKFKKSYAQLFTIIVLTAY